MRLAYGLAIALGLSFPVSGMASQEPAPPASANSAEQPAATPAPSGKAALEPQPPADTTPVDPKKPPSAATPKHRKRATPAPLAPGTPKKIVVREGGASEPAAQIAPGMAPTEASHQRENAQQWLQSTDDELKQLAGRGLETAQEETVGQIRNYMDEARSALKEGDLRRASILAEKAHLLAADLIGH